MDAIKDHPPLIDLAGDIKNKPVKQFASSSSEINAYGHVIKPLSSNQWSLTPLSPPFSDCLESKQKLLRCTTLSPHVIILANPENNSTSKVNNADPLMKSVEQAKISRTKSVTLKEYEGIHTQLLAYNTVLASSAPTKDVCKAIAEFILKHLEWFDNNSELLKMVAGPSFERLMNPLRTMQSRLLQTQTTASDPHSDPIQALKTLLKKIVPTSKIPAVLDIHIHKFLPATNEEDIAANLKIIRARMAEDWHLGRQILAGWVSQLRLPVQELDLSEEELFGIAPYLTHITLGDMEGWDNEKYNRFIDKCSNLTSLRIHTDQITHLPKRARQFIQLDCSGCSELKALPKGMHALKKLSCQRCHALPFLPGDMQALQELDCSGCAILAALPAGMHTLLKLNCSDCNRLAGLPVMQELQVLNCSRCPLLGCPLLASMPATLPNLQVLDCQHCPLLVALPIMKVLQNLNCSHCPLLAELQTMPLLQKLICCHCYALTSLSLSLPALRSLDCSHCPALAELPIDMHVLQIFDCVDCAGLKALPNGMQALLSLNCSFCARLLGLPDMPVLQKLICLYAPDLKVSAALKLQLKEFKQ